jgi:hypothetical protein
VYKKYSPEKLPHIPRMVKKHGGASRLLELVRKKYYGAESEERRAMEAEGQPQTVRVEVEGNEIPEYTLTEESIEKQIAGGRTDLDQVLKLLQRQREKTEAQPPKKPKGKKPKKIKKAKKGQRPQKGQKNRF